MDESDRTHYSPDIFAGVIREPRCCDEHAFGRALSFQTSGECLHVRSANGPVECPSLCLNVDRVQAKLVFVNNAIDPVISGPTNVSCRDRRSCATISHRN